MLYSKVMKSIQQKNIEYKKKIKRDEKEAKTRKVFKNLKEIESIFKALSSHYRIKILVSIYKNKNITLDQINEIVGGDFKNISAHTKKLENFGLVNKKYFSTQVQHQLTADGVHFVKIILDNSIIL